MADRYWPVLIATAFMVGAFCLVFSGRALPQHWQFHHHYQGWVNRDNKGCCNNQHCRPLSEYEERMDGGTIEVRIEGVWCPVLERHYLSKGNVPDASTAHVCAWGANDFGWQGKSPCERLLCFQPRPLS